MNIIELTRILNEKYSDVTKNLTPNADKLEKIAKKQGKSEEANDFLNKINSIILKEIEKQDSNSNYSLLLKRLEGFIGGSNVNNDSILNDILSMVTPQMVEKILTFTPQTLFQKNSLAELFDLKDGRTLKGAADDVKNANANVKNFLKRMAKFRPGSCGPFEVLLCLLFNGGKIDVASKDEKGDISIGGISWEVKGDGGGCIDTGIDNIEDKMKSASGSELKNLMGDLNKAKKLFNVLDSKGSQLMEKFAKKLTMSKRKELETNISNSLGGNNTMTSNDVENYFSLLDDEDKKKAVLYGFYKLGYQNIIVCGWDANFSYKVVKGADIIKCVLNPTSTVRELGIDISISANQKSYADGSTTVKTANFGSYIIKLAK